MIAAFTGDDRLRIQQTIDQQRTKTDGEYLVLDAETITKTDFLEHLQSQSLFSDQQLLVIKDLSHRADLHDSLLGLLPLLQKSPNKLILLVDESWDKRGKIYKDLVKVIKFTEYSKPLIDDKLVFSVLDLALNQKRDHLLKTLGKVKQTTEPVVLMAVIGSQLTQYDRYKTKLTPKEYREIAKSALKTDRLTKTAGFDAWLIITSWLLQLASPQQAS